MDIRDELITGTFNIGSDGRKEPPNWKDYALKLEAKLSAPSPTREAQKVPVDIKELIEVQELDGLINTRLVNCEDEITQQHYYGIQKSFWKLIERLKKEPVREAGEGLLDRIKEISKTKAYSLNLSIAAQDMDKRLKEIYELVKQIIPGISNK